jgi:hypothetical protein
MSHRKLRSIVSKGIASIWARREMPSIESRFTVINSADSESAVSP